MANKLNQYNINFNVAVVFNKTAFEKTLTEYENKDTLSAKQITAIREGSEFMRHKAFNVIMNNHVDFMIAYSNEFYKTVVASN